MSASVSNTTIGPEKGFLVIVGGGKLIDAIYEKVIELAGGCDVPIVVIPTAGGEETYGEDAGGATSFRRLGSKHVTVLHTYDPKVADTQEFVRPLENAGAVWFAGGRQWRLVDAYGGTLAEKKFWEVLEQRNGVIGGSSAGATIQGSFLARGDTKNNQIMVGDHQKGFSFLKNTVIDQHAIARNRHFDMFDILKVRPELLGLAVDENTALVVSRNEAEVIGNSYVLVFDGNFWSAEGVELKTLPDPSVRFYFLKSGDRYDLEARKPVVNKDREESAQL